MHYLGMSALVSVAVCIVASQVAQVGRAQEEGEAEGAKPKHTIKAVMEAVHKGDAALVRKVLAGDATAEEKLTLLDHYISLAENKPPKGEADAWHVKTDAIILAAAKVAVGREDATAQLRRATNCAACHRDHRPAAN
jgi:hypothetical protein